MLKHLFTTRGILLQALFSLSLIGCQSNSGGSNNTVTYQAAKTTLKEQEEASPLTYLKATGTFRKNLLGEFVIEGSVTSSATVAKFKDAILKVSFVTKTNTILGSQDFARYEFLSPGKSVPFTIKTNAPNGTEKIDLDVIKATVAN